MPLKVSDGIGAWIKDFQKSDAPQFKGKDKEERRDMAIAAYLSAKRGDKKESSIVDRHVVKEISANKADAAATERRKRMNKALDAGDLKKAEKESDRMKKNVGRFIKKVGQDIRKEAVDPSDTGGSEEISMAMRQLEAMEHFIEGIEERLKKTGDMEEWFQNKLTKAHDYLKTLYAYGKGDDDDDDDEDESMDEGSESWESGYKRRVVKTSNPEHKEKGYKYRIKGKDRPNISIKLYKEKPSFDEFKKQMKRVAGHEFGG